MSSGTFLPGWLKWYKVCYPYFFLKSVNGGIVMDDDIKKYCLIATPFGVIDYKTRTILHSHHKLLVMRMLNQDLKAQSLSNQVQAYFFQLGGWNPVIINILRATIKITAMPGLFQKLSIVPSFYGKGGSGKSTFVRLLAKIRGAEAVRIEMANLTSSTFSKQSMAGKKLITFDEINPTSLTTSRLTMLKTMITGDPIQLEVKHKDP